MAELLQQYETRWLRRDQEGGANSSSGSTRQGYIDELAREAVRPSVAEETRAQVDASMSDFIANYRHAREGPPSDKKAKKPAAGVKREGGKGAAAAAKAKPLPGSKLVADLNGRAMLSQLTSLGFIVKPDPSATFKSFIGGHNLLGSKYAATDTPAQHHSSVSGGGAWLPADPSMAQVRAALMHYAVLPLSSRSIRAQVQQYCEAHGLNGGRAPRSLLLYGPHGAGKTHLALAVANAAGALVVDLSAGRVEGALPGKTGGTQLLHMAFELARQNELGPVLILAEDTHRLLPAGGAKPKADPAAAASDVSAGGGDSDGSPARLKKDLPAYIASLTSEDAVFVIGTTAAPWEADFKALQSCFDKAICAPVPDYATRLRLWREESARQLAAVLSTSAGASSQQDGGVLTTTTKKRVPATAQPVDASPLQHILPLLPAASTADAPQSLWTSMRATATAPSSFNAASPTAHSDSVSCTAAAGVTVEEAADQLSSLNWSALASVSNGFTAGSIKSTVAATITSELIAKRLALQQKRRVGRARQAAADSIMRENDFLGPLSRSYCVFAEETQRFLEFSDKVTGLGDRWLANREASSAVAPTKGKAVAKT